MRSLRRKFASSSLVVVTLVLAFGGFSNAIVHAQQAATPTSNFNWPASAYDYQNSNNSPQTDINVKNVGSLELRWIYQIPVNPYSIPGAPPALGVETQALVRNGITYIATPYNRVIALNTATGAVVWSYQVNMTQFIGEKWWAGAYVISGISLYNQSLYLMSSDTTVYALDANTGKVQWTLPPVAANIAGNTGTYYGEKAPILVGDNLIVRASTTDYGGRGFVAAYNVNTRNMSWIWYSVPPSTGDPNWDAGQCQAPCHGNIAPYQNDWGSTSQSQSLAGGGAAWGLMAVDNKTGVVYFSTGHPSDGYEAALRPGPNLFTDSLVALNTTSGKMIWYYQYTSHDITEHEGGWSVNLATIAVNGTSQQVVIQGTKGSQIFVVNAATGRLVYKPVFIGPPAENAWNDGLTTSTTPPANLTASQALFGNNKRICPGPDGGIEMSPAIAGNTLYVATQNACGIMTAGPYPYKGSIIQGYIYNGDPSASQSSTLYAINLSTGQALWQYDMPNRYQGSSAVVSGGVVYVVDRGGIMYEITAQNGTLINSLSLGGVGAAGVSLARDISRSACMMVFAPAGGGDLPNATPGVVAAYWLGGSTCTIGTTTVAPPSGTGLEQPIIIVLAILVVVLAMYVLLKRRAPTQPRA
jgi:alcohol dehydrogenase (cytochrome c)